uniref:Uncharacterized protein n=1 Tax=Arundo donax TaxID=35708 RepID=A0A0A9BTA0_ARUDO
MKKARHDNKTKDKGKAPASRELSHHR